MSNNNSNIGNLYGYSDYNGPGTMHDNIVASDNGDTKYTSDINDSNDSDQNNNKEDEYYNDDNDDNPLLCGLWMEGDSLAPPCGTSIDTITQILQFAQVGSNDILYDMGCGDGRVCLEAYVRHNCTYCVGVEVELDLIQRFQYLISNKLPPSSRHDCHRDSQNHCHLQETRRKERNDEELPPSSSKAIETTTIGSSSSSTCSDIAPAALFNHGKIFPIHADLREILDRLIVENSTTQSTVTSRSCPSPSTTRKQEDTTGNDDFQTSISPTSTQNFLSDDIDNGDDSGAGTREVSSSSLPIPTIMFLYLLPDSIRLVSDQLLTLLEQLPNNFRIVCNTWGIPNIKPIKTVEIFEGSGGGGSSTIRLYTKESLSLS